MAIPLSPACFGVCCPKHGECARYAAAENKPAEVRVIGTCRKGQAWPMFVRIRKVER